MMEPTLQWFCLSEALLTSSVNLKLILPDSAGSTLSREKRPSKPVMEKVDREGRKQRTICQKNSSKNHRLASRKLAAV